ncbi:Na+/H+ antiporter NhaA type [[Actinomadura] parvosata subsp. kistnae]|uniref:Na(+)/H(+) antiporter NhaA n=1 Tax=[Actinomadura] parvosata subsp. kistnae TaxID=1909395 RepID=A0A1V0AHU9_9ACTN|nr:Na+/H+ antiporter NhaA [Nonomuraea sp. ATCC 55076]AQZ69788.1 Na+/H+ antiporter NhaA [Nonomuraea sp. ATCC 55076]SPL90071.1 Na+/H+ antiporter NhaA type [Actinomadura parvosata subsp. kistnae]
MLRAFLRTEAGSTSVLLVATALALLWANSPWGGTYEAFWHTSMGISFGGAEFSLDLRHWVNDGLMTVFFFLIGLEVSYEVRLGQLRDRRLIAVPAVAAFGGMLVPAGVYLLLNYGGPGAGGWGVPIATDTAFVLGLLAVVGARCPDPLRAFLLTLAIVDDVLAIIIIAIFYTDELSVTALITAAVLLAAIMTLRWLKIWRAPAYIVLGFALWVATLESGIHPTLIGIALGVLVFVYAPTDHKLLLAGEAVQEFTSEPSARAAREAALRVQRAVSVNERLQLRLHPWSSYVIVPVFALANAGVQLDGETLRAAVTSPVAIGVALGLLLGKFAGISLGTWLPLRLGWGVLPGNLVWGQLLGGAAVSGIGFTVALFIVDLAFAGSDLHAPAKIGILAGSLLSAGMGWLIFRLAWDRGGVCAPPEAEPAEDLPTTLAVPVGPGDHVRGPADARVTLVEYGDFECPYCGRLHPILEEVLRKNPDVRLVFRHFPLRTLHPRANAAAIVAEAAADRGRFWEMHDILYDNQRFLTDADLEHYAAELDVDPWSDVSRHAARIAVDETSGRDSGVRGTPTLFVNGVRYEGGHDLDSITRAVEESRESA